MSKPDWSEAPEWANYMAMDDDGSWYWFEVMPQYDEEQNCWFEDSINGQVKSAKISDMDGKNSLERRP